MSWSQIAGSFMARPAGMASASEAPEFRLVHPKRQSSLHWKQPSLRPLRSTERGELTVE
jgi:hypothetical protein